MNHSCCQAPSSVPCILSQLKDITFGLFFVCFFHFVFCIINFPSLLFLPSKHKHITLVFFLKIILPRLFLFFLLCFCFCWVPLTAAFVLRREAPVFKLYTEKLSFCNWQDKAAGKTWGKGTASKKPHHCGSSKQRARNRSHLIWIQSSFLALLSRTPGGKLKPQLKSRFWR